MWSIVWSIVSFLFLLFIASAIANILARMSMFIFFIFIKKTVYWYAYMVVLPIFAVFLSTFGSLLFRISSLFLVAFPILLEPDYLKYVTEETEADSAARSLKNGRILFIVSAVMSWIAFHFSIVPNDALFALF